jgi:hypothetical protein
MQDYNLLVSAAEEAQRRFSVGQRLQATVAQLPSAETGATCVMHLILQPARGCSPIEAAADAARLTCGLVCSSLAYSSMLPVVFAGHRHPWHAPPVLDGGSP